MKRVEDVSASIQSLSGVISASFNFARNSPSMAKQSLLTAADYLQTRTTQSTVFLIGFWIAMLDLMKNEHTELLVTSLLAILDNILQLIRLDDFKIVVRAGVALGASEPIKELVNNFGNCVKSFIHILRTEEISNLRTQVFDMVEHANAKRDRRERRKAKRRKKRSKKYHRQSASMSGIRAKKTKVKRKSDKKEMSSAASVTAVISESPKPDLRQTRSASLGDREEQKSDGENTTGNTVSLLSGAGVPENIGEEGEDMGTHARNGSWLGGIGSSVGNVLTLGYLGSTVTAGGSSIGVPSLPPEHESGTPILSSEATDTSDSDSDSGSDNILTSDGNSSDLSSVSDDSEGERKRKPHKSKRDKKRPLKAKSEEKTTEFDHDWSDKWDSVWDSQWDNNAPTDAPTNKSDVTNKPPQTSLSRVSVEVRESSADGDNSSAPTHVPMLDSEAATVVVRDSPLSSRKSSVVNDTAPKPSNHITINDWVSLLQTIDRIEDIGIISISEGSFLRKKARQQNLELLILYRCYSDNIKRFSRYARDFINDLESAQRISSRVNPRGMSQTSLNSLDTNQSSIRDID